MVAWELWGVVGFIFLILEIFTPSMFFLNFAVSAFITAVASLFIETTFYLILVFAVFSLVSFVFLRPILVRKFSKAKETGMNSKYIGQIAKVEKEINAHEGVITIYGERWEARSENGAVISQGSEVKIVRNESIIMYVEECNN
ncbi:MAG: NfeD family protein [Cyanobacteria bacterium SIG28]|nr:NfeD family protein [Cyanobacteria bacterium SIG28]